MNREQKEILQSQLNNEKQTINELKDVYSQALKDCEGKIKELSMRKDMENLQSIIYQKQYQQAIKGQLEGILEQLHGDSFSTVSDYLARCYEDGFIGVMYDLAGQGIPLIIPIDQDQVVKAIQTDSKLSKTLYDRLGEDVNALKKAVRQEVSRGIASGASWNDVAANLASNFTNTPFNKAYNNSIRIARTEGHRIGIQAAMDAQEKAKKKGADVVKQWDATLDGRTRDSHRLLDGQIRELDEDFEVNGRRVSAPSMFGDPSEDCNCRCALLQRARWALDDDELETLKKRAEYYELDKTKDFDEFKEKYLKASKGLGANDDGFDLVPEHKAPEFIGKIDSTDQAAVQSTIRKFEQEAVKEDIETACVITKDGLVYKCYGVKNGVFPDFDLGDRLFGATMSHNHPIDVTEYSFSKLDFELFQDYDLHVLRGFDEVYEYEFNRSSKIVDEHIPIFEFTEEDYAHDESITRAENAHIGYRRRKR